MGCEPATIGYLLLPSLDCFRRFDPSYDFGKVAGRLGPAGRHRLRRFRKPNYFGTARNYPASFCFSRRGDRCGGFLPSAQRAEGAASRSATCCAQCPQILARFFLTPGFFSGNDWEKLALLPRWEGGENPPQSRYCNRLNAAICHTRSGGRRGGPFGCESQDTIAK